MEAFFDAAVEKVTGLAAVVVSTESGQIIMSSSSYSAFAASSSFESNSGISSEVGGGDEGGSGGSGEISSALLYFAANQLSKLKLGKLRSVTARYGKGGYLVHVNVLPLVVTFFGDADLDVALVQTMVPDLMEALRPLQDKVAADSQQDAAIA